MRPTRDMTMMGLAEVVAQRSTCSRLAVGAVIVRDSRAISTGYNGRPAGMAHCDHDQTSAEPCRLAVHAEANAVAFAARYGAAVAGAELFTTHQPCLDCAKLVVNAGISRVVYRNVYRDDSGLNLLLGCGVATMMLAQYVRPWVT